MTLDSSDYVEELKYAIKRQDQIKIDLVLNDFDIVDLKTQRMLVYELLGLLNSEENENILALAITALGEMIFQDSLGKLNEFIYSSNKLLSFKAIHALGKFDNIDAVQSLVAALKKIDKDTDFAILDVLAASKNISALKALNKLLGSHYFHLRSYAKEKLTSIGERVVPFLAENLDSGNLDLLVQTLNVLGDIGSTNSAAPVRKLLIESPEDPNVRFAAYEALGNMSIKQGAYMLAAGLEDPVEDVAIAAAKAIDANYSDVLRAGLKNLVEANGVELKRVVKIIIISEADKVFLSLTNYDNFVKTALHCLKNEVSADLRSHFAELLNNNSAFSEILGCKQEKTKGLKEVWAVDDSKLILHIYKNLLYSLGVNSREFDSPLQALETLKTSKPPSLLFTDFNMPGLSGIEFAQKVKECHPQLPIIMVTTQSDVNESSCSCIEKIMHKPFTQESLGEAIKEILPGFLEI